MSEPFSTGNKYETPKLFRQSGAFSQPYSVRGRIDWRGANPTARAVVEMAGEQSIRNRQTHSRRTRSDAETMAERGARGRRAVVRFRQRDAFAQRRPDLAGIDVAGRIRRSRRTAAHFEAARSVSNSRHVLHPCAQRKASPTRSQRDSVEEPARDRNPRL